MNFANHFADEYARLLHYGEENSQFLDIACASLLALCPILQYYVGIFEDAGITILIAVMPWIALRLLYKVVNNWIPLRNLLPVVGFLLFFVYRCVIHGILVKEILFNAALLVLFLAAVYGCVNVKQFITASSYVASAACVLVFIQTLSYYLLHRHIQLAPTALFTAEADPWILQAKTGVIGVTQRVGKLYRPSAFFMEPSHMFLYTFPHLYLMLLSPDLNRARIRRALLYTLGIVLCTSGMGVVISAGAWALYYSMSSGKKNRLHLHNLLKPRNFLLAFLFVIFSFAVAVTVPFVRESILRFLDFSDSGAIAGRTRLASNLLESLRGTQLLFGVTNTVAGLSFNMSGFAATLYKYGIVGVLLSYWTYLYGVFRLKGSYFWISLIIVGVSFFSAQTHGVFYMIYYTFFIFAGWNGGFALRGRE